MMNLIQISYNSEIWLKSRKVQMRMLNILINNIKRMLKRDSIPFHKYQLSKDSTRIYFFFDNADIPRAIEVLKHVFGIDSISPALRTSNKMKNIIERVIQVGSDILEPNDTFALRVKRSGNHEFSSKDVAEQGGKAILDTFGKLDLNVDLGNPRKKIFVEIRGEFSHIYTRVIKTPWAGLPIERIKRILIMDVGRREDLLAGFLLARRGSEIYPLLFKVLEDEAQIDTWISNWREISKYLSVKYFYLNVINLKPILDVILKKLQEKNQICAICRLLRFDIISRLLSDSQNQNFAEIKAISDGAACNRSSLCSDEIDLESLMFLPNFTIHPIFTPVIGLEQKEMGDYIHKISNNLSELDYCQYKPKNQNIDIERIIELYNLLDLDELIKDSLETTQSIKIF